MATDNQITIIGNLTRDPELRMTRNDNALVNLGLAVNRRVNNNGQWQDKLDGYFNVTAWNDYARNVARSLKKGDRVIVIGRMIQNTYKDQQGNDRTSYDIQADEIAPSLKWATVQVERVRGSGGGNYSGNDAYNHGGTPYPATPDGGYAPTGSNGFPPPVNPDAQPYDDAPAPSGETPF